MVKKVIIDTDFSSDVGDGLALFAALGLHRVGIINIIGIICSSSNSKAPGAIDAACELYGQTIPIGCWKGAALDPSGPGAWTATIYDGFTHSLGLASTVDDGLSVYTTLLTDNSDITIVALGGANSLNELMVSNSALVNAKVTELVWMCGDYPTCAVGEFNILFDQSAATNLMANWPTPITYSGFTLGQTLYSGGNLRNEYSAGDLRRDALLASSVPFGDPSWDLQPFLWLVYGKQLYSVTKGSNATVSGGINTFTPSASGKDQYITDLYKKYRYAPILNSWIAIASNATSLTWKYGQEVVSL